MEKKVEKIEIKWPTKKPLIAKMNLPVVKVVNVDTRRNGNASVLYNIFDGYNKHIHSSFGEAGIELSADDKFPEKFNFFDFRTDFYNGDRSVDCFSFESLKKQDSLDPSEYGKLGWATNLHTSALNNMHDYIKERNGTKTMYPVLLYGYIPAGTKYYKVKSFNGYYKHIDRYIAEHVFLLPMNEQTKITELTGYWEFLEYIN